MRSACSRRTPTPSRNGSRCVRNSRPTTSRDWSRIGSTVRSRTASSKNRRSCPPALVRLFPSKTSLHLGASARQLASAGKHPSHSKRTQRRKEVSRMSTYQRARDLNGERMTVWHRAKELLDRAGSAGGLTAQDQANVNAAFARIDAIDAERDQLL